jgi:hypothetical protein
VLAGAPSRRSPGSRAPGGVRSESTRQRTRSARLGSTVARAERLARRGVAQHPLHMRWVRLCGSLCFATGCGAPAGAPAETGAGGGVWGARQVGLCSCPATRSSRGVFVSGEEVRYRRVLQKSIGPIPRCGRMRRAASGPRAQRLRAQALKALQPAERLLVPTLPPTNSSEPNSGNAVRCRAARLDRTNLWRRQESNRSATLGNSFGITKTCVRKSWFFQKSGLGVSHRLKPARTDEIRSV